MRAEAGAAAVRRYLPATFCRRSPAETGNGCFLYRPGALMSKVSFYEGNSVPGIAQGVVLEWADGEVEES